MHVDDYSEGLKEVIANYLLGNLDSKNKASITALEQERKQKI
jgi:hypothetical protein